MITLASKTKFEAEIKSLKEALAAKESAFVKLSEDFEAIKTELAEQKSKPPVTIEKENTEAIDALKAELATAKAALEGFEAKVNEKALDVVASQGAAPVRVLMEPKKDGVKNTGTYGSRLVYIKQ